MSSTGTYTPGPWSYEEPDAVGLPHLRAANGDAIATFLRDPWNSSDIPLIAAAPELLECLKHIQGIVSESQGVAGWHQNGQVASWDELGICEEINAVLAKVRGEME